jgi:hypothetical protein
MATAIHKTIDYRNLHYKKHLKTKEIIAKF